MNVFPILPSVRTVPRHVIKMYVILCVFPSLERETRERSFLFKIIIWELENDNNKNNIRKKEI